MLLRRALASLSVLTLLTLVLGCGKGFDATVTGKVTVDGQPLTKGDVTFAPQGSGRVAYGAIDATGNYVIKTGEGEGVPPGEYGVTIVATGVAKDSFTPPPLLTPQKYSDVKTSGLTASVKPGKNTFDYHLKSGE
jgi:hypothetical protein